MLVLSWNVNGLRALLKKHRAVGALPAAAKKARAKAAPPAAASKGGLAGWLGKAPAAAAPLPAMEGPLSQLLQQRQPALLFLQETKTSEDTEAGVEADLAAIAPGYSVYWNHCRPAVRKGYSGTAVLVRDAVLPRASCKVHRGIAGVGGASDAHDAEGRVIRVETASRNYVGAYVPNSSNDGLKRLAYRAGPGGWDEAFRLYLNALAREKPTILLGDLNVAHAEEDLHDPKSNRNKTPGFCDEERDNFSALLADGWVDTWRAANPLPHQQFTYWSYRFNARAKNKGWRLDYAVADSAGAAADVQKALVLDDVEGSDHVPVGVRLAGEL